MLSGILKQVNKSRSRWYTIAKTRFLTYNLYLGVKVTQNVAQYRLHNMTYAPVKFEVNIPMVKEKKHLQKIHCMTLTYAPAKFEIATSNSLGEDAFTRKYII